MDIETRIKLSDLNGYYGTPFRRWINENLSDYIKDYCPSNDARILDLGCGEGQYIRFFESVSVKGSYIGIDYVIHDNWSYLNNNNKKNGLELAHLQYDAHEIANIAKKFNFIQSITAFEHFENDKKVMTQLKNILDKEGRLLIIVPSKYSFLNYGKHGYRRYSKRNMKILNDCGQMKIERIDKICGLASFIFHTIWHWAFRLISLSLKLMIVLFFLFNKKKARERLPRLHLYLDDLKFVHLLNPVGKAIHKMVLILCSKIDKIFPFFEVGYLVIYKHK